jgi:hypothetical protein
MRTKLQILATVFWLLAAGFAKAQITDNFTDGNFTSAPAWIGNDTDFIVNTAQQLQLNSSGSGKSYLVTANAQPLANCEWNFWISLTFSPSSSNYARVYLVSDQQDVSGSLNGYYLQFGESLSNDQVELFQQSGMTFTSVCRGTTLISNSFAIRVKVTRDNSGLWKLFIDPAGGTNYSQEASGTDNTFATTSFFGMLSLYTSSNATKHYFDDFYVGPIIVDTLSPSLDSIAVISQNQLDVYFSEGLDTASANTEGNYSANNGIGTPSAAVRDATISSLVHLTFSANFPSGISSTLTASGVKDMAGNTLASGNGNFIFYLTQPASANDIIVNEILFDPLTNGVEWVEIYNRSDKIIDLKNVSICNLDAAGQFSNIRQIAPGGRLMFPKEYIVLSKDQSIIKSQYITTNPNGFIDFSSFISMNNDSAHVVLMDAAQNIIDHLHYHSEWHLPLLNDTKGISLERINFNAPAQDASNWHSASESVGGATPAYKNSQYTDGESGSEITISPEVFSPDNDGYNDVLSISYAFDSPGMIGNLQIYDSRGRLEKTLVRNELLATRGTFFWDGITDEKLKARIGIYIIYFEAFDQNGNVKKYKKTCVVGGKF